jgi:NADH dehydrogenase
MTTPTLPPDAPRIVIVGAGFAGLACAKALGGARAHVAVIDRNNYHLFVPLLYQVATAALSPADIAHPIRRILRRHRNVEVALGELGNVDTEARQITLTDGRRLDYDALVLATGSHYNYFGHDEWRALAPGPRTIMDARLIRSKVLTAFERAEHEPDAATREALLTIVIVGGGPTGVELAGAIAELARYALKHEFRHIEPASTRIILIEAGPRLLGGFPEDLSTYARRRLEKLGVEVWCGRRVSDLGADRVRVDGTTLRAGAVLWGAGIRASSCMDLIDAPRDALGRVLVTPFLSAVGLHDVYIIGDSAAFTDPETGQPLPALAQVAQQQGRHLGRGLARLIGQGTPLEPFRFRNRGDTAIVGRNAAVFDFKRWKLKGRPAWLLWAVVHVYLLVGFEKRILVCLQWLWRYVTFQRGARLITEGASVNSPGPAEGVRTTSSARPDALVR